MPKYTICRGREYVCGHLRYGHDEVVVEAETKEEALAKGNELLRKGCGETIVDDYEIDDKGGFEGDAYIAKEE